jgi:ATP-dependent Clp protease ATP-binding subunit ClpC
MAAIWPEPNTGESSKTGQALIEEIQMKNIIIFIDEIHTIIGAGAAEGAIDAANILKPALARGELQCIGATTLNEYRLHVEKDAALVRRFQSVMVDEPSAEQSLNILKGLKPRYEEHHKVQFRDDALEEAVNLSARYINDRFLPDKAIDILDEAGAMHAGDLNRPDDFAA